MAAYEAGKHSNSAEHISSSINNATVQKVLHLVLNAAAVVQKLTIRSLLQVGISFVARALLLKLDFSCKQRLLK